MPGPRKRFVISGVVIASLTLGTYVFGNPTLQSQRRSRESKPENTPVKKGKKGLAGNSKKVEPSNTSIKPTSKPSTSTTAAAVKPASVTPPVILPPATQPVPAQPAPTQPTPINTASDKIEVIEHKPPLKSPSAASGNVKSSGGVYGISNRRMDVEIEAHRVIQIQKALKERGFFSSEPSGIYDDETIEGMKAFQAKERIDVTGYPTAHALKRLGL